MPLNSERPVHADIFCRVVDNFGDIGVCWRLARRLAHGHGWRIRLWVDDLDTFSRLAPQAGQLVGRGRIQGVDIVHWTPALAGRAAAEAGTAIYQPGDVVIEAFACDPPRQLVERIGASTVWVNLEYLSAEDWVDACHALPSPQAGGVPKYFFFPGFTPSTGGLLREPDLLRRRDAFQTSQEARANFLLQLGVPAEDVRLALDGQADLVSLFCYMDAPVAQLHEALAARQRRSVLLATHGTAPWLSAGATGSTRVVRLPFLSQDDFDSLLWGANVNFVRGEDSFVRAQWAGRPLVWQAYPQHEAAHLDKLEAWLGRYTTNQLIASVHRAWNGGEELAQLSGFLPELLEPHALQRWTAQARQWCTLLAGQNELADQLADFCLRRLK